MANSGARNLIALLAKESGIGPFNVAKLIVLKWEIVLTTDPKLQTNPADSIDSENRVVDRN